MTTETIGERRRKRREAEVERQNLPSSAVPVLAENRHVHPMATNLYLPPVVRDRFSELPVGRHRPEYILSQGEAPRYMQTLRPEIQEVQSLPSEMPPVQRRREPQIVPVQSLPQRFPSISPDAEKPETTTSTLVLPGDFPIPSASRPPNRSARDQTRPEPGSPATKPASEQGKLLRSQTEKRIHAKPRKGRKVIALAALVALAGAAVVGGGILFKDKKSSSSSKQTSAEFSLPAVPAPPEIPIIPVLITEQDKITANAGNQWNAAADKTEEALGHSSNAVTNIVAKVGAYDSRSTSPDPDAAQAGDSFTSLTESAISWVDRLQDPLSPDASAAQIDAAQIIHMLNNLGPMDTKYFIEHYGNHVETLKADLIAILTPQEQPQKQQTSQRTSTQETTVYASATDKTDTLSNSKKAIAALAREQQNRQRQPSYAI